MKKNTLRYNIINMLPLLLFVLFSTCILYVLLAGANVYRSFLNRDQNTFNHRTTVQYITTRVHQSDLFNNIFVGDFENPQAKTSGNTLYLREEINGRTFYTRIYCHNGSLYELFSEADHSFLPNAGQAILEVSDIYFTIENDILQIHFTYKDYSTDTLFLYLHSGKEAIHEK